MSNIIDRTFAECMDDLGGLLERHFSRLLNELPRKPESPIEEALLMGLLTFGVSTHCIYFEGSTFWRKTDTFPVHCVVRPQYQWNQYRVDIAVEVFFQDATIGWIMVECDGHEHHERTKEQASRDKARDRAMTTEGHVVMRFTGSDIYRSALGCAHEVWNAVIAMADRYEAASQ